MRTKEIKVWMLRNNIKAVDIARQTGVDQSFISHWIAGRRRSERIAEYFISLGCPSEYIDQGQEETEAA